MHHSWVVSDEEPHQRHICRATTVAVDSLLPNKSGHIIALSDRPSSVRIEQRVAKGAKVRFRSSPGESLEKQASGVLEALNRSSH